MIQPDDSFERGQIELTRIKDELVAARKRKDYREAVRLCLEAIELAWNYPELEIAPWIFVEDIGLAFERLKEPEKALDFLKLALGGLKKDKDETGWKDEMAVLRKKIARLEKGIRE